MDATDQAGAPLVAVVLAAGSGSRMRSARPKPLHLLSGRAMLLHILDAVAGLEVQRAVVVVGHGAERVTKKLIEHGPPALAIDFVEQQVQRGTGDAVMVALTAFRDDDDEGDVVVVPGDAPLLSTATLARLVSAHRQADAAATLLTTHLDDPTGYGRVVRGRSGGVAGIVEEVDADEEQRQIQEVAMSIYCFRRSVVAPALRRITPDNAKGEYYLTDVVAVLAEAGYRVGSLVVDDAAELSGVNDRGQLAAAEAELRRRTNARWLAAGVTMVDPDRTYIDTGVRLGADVTLFPGTILQGTTVVGGRSEIGPDTRLVDTVVGEGAVVANTVAVSAEVGDGAVVGPFAHLEPGASVAAGATTGPFYASGGGGDASSPPGPP
ncbi:MAG: N-acetylglucosamine-1-phosphate uridyltransferase / Glucosamine-1-phosphate N-acetyltransferase [uncultured Acidimicrobiales bacterium]|uniref:N-acetylglucosamine-1-phosphate uridyltransferase / Glucosamine-1-phosphate N-acetyltransferase n=1 Tax=uncultured Acidimicrobiales bacterium TaxID=310071 RepID=A0A6J4I912_9ACTN|nr:MAG: N-acetylglucosamine-1-phosphate uridyltransferase / Glucosamine-1-phosphate N-acetyltransferase [uncultured Acidimicrobiales bacterium]